MSILYALSVFVCVCMLYVIYMYACSVYVWGSIQIMAYLWGQSIILCVGSYLIHSWNRALICTTAYGKLTCLWVLEIPSPFPFSLSGYWGYRVNSLAQLPMACMHSNPGSHAFKESILPTSPFSSTVCMYYNFPRMNEKSLTKDVGLFLFCLILPESALCIVIFFLVLCDCAVLLSNWAPCYHEISISL